MSFKKALFGLYRLFYEILLCLGTWVTPKRDQLYLLAPFYNDILNGNLGAMYRYLEKNHPQAEIIIVASDRLFYLDLKKQGKAAVLSGTAQCFIATARARYLLIDHNTNTVFWWGILQALTNLKVIQLWHGAGFKQIVLIDEKTKPRSFFEALRYYDITVRCKNYNCILSSSDEDKSRKKNSFQNRNVVITGYPKNDILFDSSSPNLRSSIREGGRFDYIFLYAPTFRDRGSFQPFSGDFWAELEKEMAKLKGLFLVKKHPQDNALEVPSGFENIKDISEGKKELQAVLKDTDLLITDYSNISVDFVLTGKPVVYYIFDYESYTKNCRNFYYDLKKTLPGPFVYDQDTLLSYINDTAWFKEKEYLKRYASFRYRFHFYQDGESCKRVAETCLKI